MTWEPRAWREELTWLIDIVKALPYKPSLRWCDYRVMDKFGIGKMEFKTFEKSVSKARKNFWNGWHPNTLKDSARLVYYRGYGSETFEEMLEVIVNREWNAFLWSKLPFYVEVWFEAEAMEGQFRYYLEPLRITSRPFRGDYTIPMKWRASQELVEMMNAGKEIQIFYFGDCDKKGESIPQDALKDIFAWGRKFEPIYGGLNLDQARKYALPPNPERPNQWQWEALKDEQAREIILEILHSHINMRELEDALNQVKTIEQDWKKKLKRKLGVK